MKTIYSILTLIILISFTSCDKETESNSRCNVIPCISTFSAKIDGINWQAQSQGSCNSTQSSYYPDGTEQLDSGYLIINGTYCNDLTSIGIAFENMFETGTYDLKTRAQSTSYIDPNFSVDPDLFLFNNIVKGSLSLTLLQDKNYDYDGAKWGRAQGTFWVTLTNINDDTVKITDGVFDVEL